MEYVYVASLMFCDVKVCLATLAVTGHIKLAIFHLIFAQLLNFLSQNYCCKRFVFLAELCRKINI